MKRTYLSLMFPSNKQELSLKINMNFEDVAYIKREDVSYIKRSKYTYSCSF